MTFHKKPIIEEPPRCLVCSDVMYDQRWEDGLICSATCADIWLMQSAERYNYSYPFEYNQDEALYD